MPREDPWCLLSCGMGAKSGPNPGLATPDSVRVGRCENMAAVRSREKTANGVREYASPACSMHEVDPSYMGWFSESETLDFLSDLLKRERFATRIFARSGMIVRDPALAKLVLDVGLMQRTLCDLVQGEVSARAGQGGSKGKSLSQPSLNQCTAKQRLELGCEFQQDLTRRIETALPKIQDAALLGVLKMVLEGHAALVARIQSNLLSGT